MTRNTLKDDRGGALVEFVLTVPLLLILTLGIIEYGISMQVWTNATKAAHWGARTAIVSAPVADEVLSPATLYDVDWGTNLGTNCWDKATGAPAKDPDTSAVLCKDVTVTCKPAAAGVGTDGPGTGTCTVGAGSTATWNEAAFLTVLERMRWILPSLDREDVTIEYSNNGLGFVGRPGGLPMTVTVRIQCVEPGFVLLHGLFMFIQGGENPWENTENACGAALPGVVLPPVSSTLTGESFGQVGT